MAAVQGIHMDIPLSDASSDRCLGLDADVGLAAGGCDFLAGMGQLQMLSLARTRLDHASLADVLGGLDTLTALSLAW